MPDEDDELDCWRAVRPEAQKIEEEHLRLRAELHKATIALHEKPEDEQLKAQVAALQSRLAELEKKAPWISSNTAAEAFLRGAPH